MANTSSEKWKDVSFGFKFTNDYRLQVSDQGQLKAFNKFSPGEPLKGSTINGYRIIRLKLYKPKDKQLVSAFAAKRENIVALRAKIKKWQLEDEKKNKTQIASAKTSLKTMLDALRIEKAKDVRNRTMYYHALVHRLVAESFVKPKSPKHTVVSHLDHDKQNNKASNLRWMTPEENYAHQQLSPIVIKEKKERRTKYRDFPRGAKLTVDKVAELKKLLKEDKSVKSLVKKFKITDTQILRIKRGEHWEHVKPAK